MYMTRKEVLEAYREGTLSTAAAQELLRSFSKARSRVPLSVGQQGLWMLQQTDPEMSAYNVPVCFRARQPVDPATLEKACRFVLTQFPVLRTVIGEEDGVPFQSVQAALPLAFEHERISLEPDRLLPYLRAKAKEPFALEQSPLVRFSLLSLSERDHILLVTVHHIIFDGASVLPLLNSLLGAYREIARGGEPVPAPAPASYGDFVEWERMLLASAKAQGHLSYWREQLAGALPTLELAADYPRSAARKYRGETRSCALPTGLAEGLKQLAASRRVNLSVMFLSLFNVLLHKYTGQQDIVVGMPTFGRPEERFEQLIGYFINVIPLRSRIEGELPFGQLLRDSQLTMLDGLDHAHYPFPLIVKGLNKSGSSEASIFQVGFMYQNFASADAFGKLEDGQRGELSLEPVKGVHQEGEFELVLEVFEAEHGFLLHLKYNPELYNEQTAQRMLRHYLCLAQDVVRTPENTVAQLSLMSPEERNSLLLDWNATSRDYPALCFHELFGEQARRTPDALAVASEGATLSYRELEEKSTILARYLQLRGVVPDALVGICTDRSLDMMVGLLGILKAGGAYLPLDPDYPTDRLNYIITDSQAALVLTQTSLSEKVAQLVGSAAEIVALDGDWDRIAALAQDSPRLERDVRLPDLAYVIYTSGSTGKPKGVMVTHRGVTNFLCSMAEQPGLTASDRMLAVTTYSFDIHGLELFLPLLVGAQCHLCDSATARDALRLMEAMRLVRPTIMQATPATWKLLFGAGWNNQQKTRILCGGEPLTEDLQNKFSDSGSQLWNMFGPTETTIWSTVKLISGDGPITIGKPIANTRVYLVDQQLRPVPVGVAGELCIAGDGLARGYLNRPELTAEKFVENPFTSGTRLYRTGDLARWRPDGEIDFLGRIDNQVKIRGYRIELGEIEAQLRSHPGVEDCVVVVKDLEAGRQLFCYFVAAGPGPGELDAGGLREHLKSVLPEYMVPAFFVPLDQLPLTPNGKINRKEVANRPFVWCGKGGAAAPPAAGIEGAVLEIFRAVLKVPDLGAQDPFFESGGDSILAVTAMQRIQKALGCEAKITALFDHSTVRELCRHLSEAEGILAPPETTGAQPGQAFASASS